MEKYEGHVIGIDAGTDAIAVLLVGLDGTVIGTGDVKVKMICWDKGLRRQDPADWKQALKGALALAYAQARDNDIDPGPCVAICPSGQMHGCGMHTGDAGFVELVPLWCDAGSKPEAEELTELFGHHVAQRLLISRWLEIMRQHPTLIPRVDFLTVPSGVIASMLDPTIRALGYGDACGAFPVDPLTGRYYQEMISKFNNLTEGMAQIPIQNLLPTPVMVGTIVGRVSQEAADYFGLTAGVPIVSPEGDQPTTFAGCRVCQPGQVSFSGGTSCCFNLVTNKSFFGKHPGVEPFLTADGERFYMVHVQNGTPPMNVIADSYAGSFCACKTFEDVMRAAANAPIDCGWLVVVPTIEPEHGLSLSDQAHAAIFNWRQDNYTPGNLARAAFVGSMFSVLYSVRALRLQNIMADDITVSGGIAQSDWTLQAIADIFDTTVAVWNDAPQGSAYGAALMALYGYRLQQEQKAPEKELPWSEFLGEMSPKSGQRLFLPRDENVATYQGMFNTFRSLVDSGFMKALNRMPWTK